MQVSPSYMMLPVSFREPKLSKIPAVHTLKARPPQERPREKILLNGPSHLSDAELLATLITKGRRNNSATDLALEILRDHHHSLAELAELDAHQLMKYKGIGPAKAAVIMAAMELCRRRKEKTVKKEVIKESKQVLPLLRPLMEEHSFENFYCIYLSKANRVLQCKCISLGGYTSTTVDPRVVFKEALDLKACRLIIAHNHPSGMLKASKADVQLTRKLQDGGKLLDIELLDHIIIAGEDYLSFREDGLLEDA